MIFSATEMETESICACYATSIVEEVYHSIRRWIFTNKYIAIFHDIWHRGFVQKRIELSEFKIYSSAFFSWNTLKTFKENLGNLGFQAGHSQWYFHTDRVKTISCGQNVHFPTKQNTVYYISAVLPFQIVPDGILSVRDELKLSLDDLYDILQGCKGWFKLSNHSDGTEPNDVENGMALPTIFVAPRTRIVDDHKLRQMGLKELLSEIKLLAQKMIKQHEMNNQRFRLVMRQAHFQRTGLKNIENHTVEICTDLKGQNGQKKDFCLVTINMKDLDNFEKEVGQFDDLLIDSILRLFDVSVPTNELLPDIFQISTRKITSEKGIDSVLLSSAIKEAYQQTNENGEVRHLLNREILEAVHYLRNRYQFGYCNEEPVKLVLRSLSTSHLFQIAGRRNGQFLYRSFHRYVKSTTDVGYRVICLSGWLWLLIVTSISLPLLYVGFQVNKVSSEDIITSSTAIFNVFILIVSPVVFQIFYKGEALSDVLSNVRHIDTQIEFKRRGYSQIPDVLQVLRLKKNSRPRFLGGPHENNTSYVWNLNPKNTFYAKQPMAFPNLEIHGYGMFEDAKGHMFMVDNWNGLFEVIIQDHLHADIPENRKKSREIPKKNLYCEDIDSGLSSSSASLRCIPVERNLKLHKTFCQPEELSRGSEIGLHTIRYEDPIPSGLCYERIISRILPFKARKRCIEISKHRLISMQRYWAEVNNTDLLHMHIGEKFPKEKNIEIHRDRQ